MSDRLTIIFFLWRREGMTSDEFADFYNDNHQELVSKTVWPPPLLFERNFRLDYPIADAVAREILSFDSFTAATFARRIDFDAWGTILADPTKARMLEDNEAEFTTPDRRVQLVAEAVSSGAELPVERAGAVYLVRLIRAEPGIDRAAFKAAHEAAFAEDGPLEGEQRRVRYYPDPDHPLSFAREAWGNEAKTSLGVVEHLTFSDRETARAGIAALDLASRYSSYVEAEALIEVRQVMRPPGGWVGP